MNNFSSLTIKNSIIRGFTAQAASGFLIAESSSLKIEGNTQFVNNTDAHLGTISIFDFKQLEISGVSMRGCSGFVIYENKVGEFEISDSTFVFEGPTMQIYLD